MDLLLTEIILFRTILTGVNKHLRLLPQTSSLSHPRRKGVFSFLPTSYVSNERKWTTKIEPTIHTCGTIQPISSLNFRLKLFHWFANNCPAIHGMLFPFSDFGKSGIVKEWRLTRMFYLETMRVLAK